MAASALDVVEERASLRILDPACGDGALLAAIAQAAPMAWPLEIFGCDVDMHALVAAKRRFGGIDRPQLSWRFEACDFLIESAKSRQSQESLFSEGGASPLQEQFDIVIANPPYVRTQVLGAQEARRLADGFGLSGRVDLYHAFAVAMTEALAVGGTLALLCSNRFMTTRTGASLRRYLQNELDVQAVYDLGDTKLFGAAVLPAVVIAKRGAVGRTVARMASVYETPSSSATVSTASSVLVALRGGVSGPLVVADRSYEIQRGALALDQGSSAPWVLAPSQGDWIAQIEEATTMRFGDVGKIRVGIKTTADQVFIRRDWEALGPNHPEPDLLLPLLTHHVAEKWSVDRPLHRVLYPYDLSRERRSPIDLTKWPKTERYLAEHRPRLEGRKYVVNGGRHWWEIWVPQRPSHWAAPKLVFPDISDKPRFFLDRTGAVVNGDCYWLSLRSEATETLGLLMMAVANSTLGSRYYDRVCGNKLYSGRRRYITQYVEKFPIPDPEAPYALKIIDLVGLLTSKLPQTDRLSIEREVDELVWRSFGFEEIPR